LFYQILLTRQLVGMLSFRMQDVEAEHELRLLVVVAVDEEKQVLLVRIVSPVNEKIKNKYFFNNKSNLKKMIKI